MITKKHPCTFRFQLSVLESLDKLAAKHGISKTAVLENLVRERAKKEKVWSGF